MTIPVDWIEANWPAPGGIVAGSTTRTGGVSEGVYASLNLGAHVGDSAETVAENRRRFVTQCELPAEPAWLSQVHGTDVVVDPTPGEPIQADAIFTRSANTVCAVMTADCLPVLVVSHDGGELAAAHAGWRGLRDGILESTLAAFQTPPEKLLVWLGPAISQKHFEVGDEVREAFVSHDKSMTDCFTRNDRGRWQADLCGLARRKLNATGIRQVFGGAYCTYGDAQRFFSHRRDGQCGRMASFVFRYGKYA